MSRPKPGPDGLAKRLADHAANRERRRAEERQAEVLESFGQADMEEPLPSWVPGLHRWRKRGDQLPPLPTAKETGKRYCRRCGCHKRMASFDAVDGKLSEACRACEGGPKAAQRAA